MTYTYLRNYYLVSVYKKKIICWINFQQWKIPVSANLNWYLIENQNSSEKEIF